MISFFVQAILRVLEENVIENRKWEVENSEPRLENQSFCVFFLKSYRYLSRIYEGTTYFEKEQLCI